MNSQLLSLQLEPQTETFELGLTES
jgi:hypothetical protein